jgi:uncharacterized membrane protein
MKHGRLLFLFAIAAAMIEALYYYPYLPERMAVHFNAAGAADGWGDRRGFFISFGISYGLAAVLFGGMGLIIRGIPEKWINLPNKAYWLAPERKEQTYDTLTGHSFFLGALTLLLLDGALCLSMMANLGGPHTMPAEILWTMLALYAAAIVGSLIAVFRRFRIPGGKA